MMSEMNLLTFLEKVSCASVGIMMDLCSGGNLMDLFLNTTFSFALALFLCGSSMCLVCFASACNIIDLTLGESRALCANHESIPWSASLKIVTSIICWASVGGERTKVLLLQ